ncbi:hypothetical protein B0H17DRAFT_330125 [Mycena rosella]|uniref:Uncharacterized protein n=1 Tax=Mycena rosella TaxID=1033263 RepID=A0AAD7CTA0_MYCRO|nr:hypothetical protein B0H17DRAFT_330125 [Mycena rosella]
MLLYVALLLYRPPVYCLYYIGDMVPDLLLHSLIVVPCRQGVFSRCDRAQHHPGTHLVAIHADGASASGRSAAADPRAKSVDEPVFAAATREVQCISSTYSAGNLETIRIAVREPSGGERSRTHRLGGLSGSTKGAGGDWRV